MKITNMLFMSLALRTCLPLIGETTSNPLGRMNIINKLPYPALHGQLTHSKLIDKITEHKRMLWLQSG
ncbi:hypothetical protein AAHE18_17G046600 [Arachis hypogaea]